MRVLHVIDSGGIYGAEAMLLDLMRQQRLRGLQPLLCSTGERGDPEKAIERRAAQLGVPVFTVRFRTMSTLSGGYEILGVARREAADILHLHGYKESILVGFVPRAARRI